MEASVIDIANKVKRIIHQQLDVAEDAIQENSSFVDDLGADSLAMVELVLAMEEAFEVTISEEEAQHIRTVADAISFIQQRHRQSAAREAS
jgi:acyl carrier protein